MAGNGDPPRRVDAGRPRRRVTSRPATSRVSPRRPVNILAADDSIGPPYGALETGEGTGDVSPACAGVTTSASRRTRRSPTPSGRPTSSRPARACGATYDLPAPDRRRHVRPDRSRAGARQSHQPGRDRRLSMRVHAQVVTAWPDHLVGGIPADAIAVTGNVTITRPDGWRAIVAVTTTPTSTPALVDDQLPDQRHARQQPHRRRSRRTASCRSSTRPPRPARRPTSSSTSPATSCPATDDAAFNTLAPTASSTAGRPTADRADRPLPRLVSRADADDRGQPDGVPAERGRRHRPT